MAGNNITLREIAKKANVSVTTASMFLNGKAKEHRISQKTCERLREVMQRENYQPNINARAMAMKTTNLIGCVLRNDLEDSFWMEILSGLNEVLQSHNYHLVLTVSSGKPEEELNAFKFLRAKGVDAYVWVPVIGKVGAYNLNAIQKLTAGYPIITMTYLEENLSGVATDEEIGGKLVAECFSSNGHDKVAVIGGNQIFSRGFHFRHQLVLAGAKVNMFPNVKSYLPHIREYTAVFCFSDLLALELYKCCAAKGLKIPRDVSIIGYDNMSFTRLMNPELTTIHQQKHGLGQAGGKLILDLLADPSRRIRQIKLVPTLIERDSVQNIKTKKRKRRSA